jgi:hypothetical protein
VTTSTTSTSTVLPPPVPTNFRLTGLDPTGAKLYFSRFAYGGLYDILLSTTNVSESPTFHLDDTKRLWFNSTNPNYLAPVYAFYSAPWAANNQKPQITSSTMFAFQTDKWLANSANPVYTAFNWEIDPYTLALTQTSFPAVNLFLQVCKQNFGLPPNQVVRPVVAIGQTLQNAASCSPVSSLAVESVDS